MSPDSGVNWGSPELVDYSPTTAIYGIAATPLARRLGLASRNATGVLFAGADTWTRLVAKALKNDGHQVMLLDTNDKNISAAKMEGLDAHRANILSSDWREIGIAVRRGGEYGWYWVHRMLLPLSPE